MACLSNRQKMRKLKFEWTDTEDDELYNNGVTIIWVAGRSKAIQRFVEELSYKIGYKCDYAFTGGRAHVDVSLLGYSEALEIVKNIEFMKQFIVPYSKKTWDDETYLEILR